MNNKTQVVVQISDFFHDKQMPHSENQSTILQESVDTQMNDLESKIYSDHDVREFSNRENFEFIFVILIFPFILIFLMLVIFPLLVLTIFYKIKRII